MMIGTDPEGFLAISLVLMCGAGILAGQALGANWRPYWQLAPASLLLAFADRFLAFALFGQDIRSLPSLAVDIAVIGAIATLSYRAARAAKMIFQYPWLYERDGIFGWRDRR